MYKTIYQNCMKKGKRKIYPMTSQLSRLHIVNLPNNQKIFLDDEFKY